MLVLFTIFTSLSSGVTFCTRQKAFNCRIFAVTSFAETPFFILFDFTATYVANSKPLYNAVGFAVRCICDIVALTCIEIISTYLPGSVAKYRLLFLTFCRNNHLAQIRAERAQILLKSFRSNSYTICTENLAQIGTHLPDQP